MNSDTRTAALQQLWRQQAIALLLVLSLIVITWLPAYQLLIGIWNSNGTYTHGYLIAPISLYLAWQMREHWLTTAPQPWWTILSVIAVCSLLYTFGMMGDLVGVQHAAAVLIVIAVCAFFLGPSASKTLYFPLLYLLFAIPFGEFLLPVLMAFTANFTVMALNVVGIPVFHEGLYFSLPSGNWSVIEACSGLRYVIASLALGVLYAWLNYRSRKRRLIFIALSAVVPVFANGLRAFLIVSLGHLSNMRLAVGVDHIIYGWLFFALVMFLMFWIGMRWREDGLPVPAPSPVPATVNEAASVTTAAATRPLILATLACLIAALTLPLAAMQLKQRMTAHATTVDLQTLAPTLTSGANHFVEYTPYFLKPRASLNHQGDFQSKPLGIFIGYYSGQAADRKLISIANKIVSTRQRAEAVYLHGQTTTATEIAGGPAQVVESEIEAHGSRLLVWHWFHACGQTTASETHAKLLQLQCTFTHLDDSGAVIVLYTPLGAHRQAAQQQLATATQKLWPEIETALKQTKPEVPQPETTSAP
ncbi:MAG: exosortase A [Burkholderiaceae bacterium]|nr:MAG: exosortase A [Burkholderiaceae bacterium]